jgi:hypothetical protein
MDSIEFFSTSIIYWGVFGADSLAFCWAFSDAGLDLCGAVGRGAGGYRGGLCLNQLIGFVLLKYLIQYKSDKVSVYFLL